VEAITLSNGRPLFLLMSPLVSWDNVSNGGKYVIVHLQNARWRSILPLLWVFFNGLPFLSIWKIITFLDSQKSHFLNIQGRLTNIQLQLLLSSVISANAIESYNTWLLYSVWSCNNVPINKLFSCITMEYY
jgi:hypothetical protein